MILFKTEPGRLNRIILNNGKYLIPRKDGHIVAGSTLEYVGFDKSTTDDACHLLMSEAVSIVPFLAKTPVVSQWAGLRPGSADGTPTIDWHPRIGQPGYLLRTFQEWRHNRSRDQQELQLHSYNIAH